MWEADCFIPSYQCWFTIPLFWGMGGGRGGPAASCPSPTTMTTQCHQLSGTLWFWSLLFFLVHNISTAELNFCCSVQSVLFWCGNLSNGEPSTHHIFSCLSSLLSQTTTNLQFLHWHSSIHHNTKHHIKRNIVTVGEQEWEKKKL